MKNILVASPYLNSGGVEVALIRFLKELSKNNNVTLLLLKKEGIYLKDVPECVKIIKLEYDSDIYSYDHQIKDIKNIKGIKDKVKFFKYRLKLRKYLKNNDLQGYYSEMLKHVIPIKGIYDLAIDFHGYAHFLTTVVADKVEAKKKAFWIHDEKNEWINNIKSYLDKFDKIYCVSLAAKKTLLKHNKSLESKADVFYNLTDYENVRKKALEKMDFKYDKNKTNIITVGRLEWQKAYDIAILIAKTIKEKKFKFNWYVIGGGTKKEEIISLIKEHHLEDSFHLLGIKKNPFPYIKNADLYVQPSRHEGYGLAICEAKILGIIPIVTDLDCVKEQITPYENGLLCKLDPEEFADKIIEIASNKKLQAKIKENLAKENFDYTKEFNKLYKLMEE